MEIIILSTFLSLLEEFLNPQTENQNKIFGIIGDIISESSFFFKIEIEE